MFLCHGCHLTWQHIFCFIVICFCRLTVATEVTFLQLSSSRAIAGQNMSTVTSVSPQQQRKHVSSSAANIDDTDQQLNTDPDQNRSSDSRDVTPGVVDVTVATHSVESGISSASGSGAGIVRASSKTSSGEKRRKSTWMNVSLSCPPRLSLQRSSLIVVAVVLSLLPAPLPMRMFWLAAVVVVVFVAHDSVVLLLLWIIQETRSRASVSSHSSLLLQNNQNIIPGASLLFH